MILSCLAVFLPHSFRHEWFLFVGRGVEFGDQRPGSEEEVEEYVDALAWWYELCYGGRGGFFLQVFSLCRAVNGILGPEAQKWWRCRGVLWCQIFVRWIVLCCVRLRWCTVVAEGVWLMFETCISVHSFMLKVKVESDWASIFSFIRRYVCFFWYLISVLVTNRRLEKKKKGETRKMYESIYWKHGLWEGWLPERCLCEFKLICTLQLVGSNFRPTSLPNSTYSMSNQTSHIKLTENNGHEWCLQCTLY